MGEYNCPNTTFVPFVKASMTYAPKLPPIVIFKEVYKSEKSRSFLLVLQAKEHLLNQVRSVLSCLWLKKIIVLPL